MAKEFKLSQPQRLASLTVDLLIVFFACLILFGSFYPPIGDTANKGFWGYSALLAVLIGSKLVTPFYIKPVDALSYGVPASVALLLVNDWSNWSINQRWVYSLALGYSSLIIFFGITNILLNSRHSDFSAEWSNRIRIGLNYFGSPEFIFTPVILFAIFTYHLDSAFETFIICIVLGTTVWWSIGDFLIGVYYKLKSTISSSPLNDARAQVVAFQEPGIVLLRQFNQGDIKRHDILLVNDHHGPQKLVVALDEVGRSEGILTRTVNIAELSDLSSKQIGDLPYSEYAYSIDEQSLADICDAQGITKDQQSAIVGLVTKDSTIDRLFFEVTNNSELEEGRLVSVNVGAQVVLYQIVGGLTQEEIVQNKNTFGFIRGQAQQIGIWDEEPSKFKQCSWLPNTNTPVYLVDSADHQFDASSVGHFPRSNFSVSINNVNQLVTHNTAILGILGIGKSMLSVELIERMLAAEIKVLCIDLTDEYKDLLADYYVNWYQKNITKELNDIANRSKANVSKNVEEGGGVKEFSTYIRGCLQSFIENEDIRLLVINPSDFEVWRQDSKPFNNEASMASLTPTEVTQIVADAALKVVQPLGKPEDERARLCLAFEEAHSLVPEFNSIVAPGDKSATNGTARAILQGRKYGLGCLLITQRTANVTKTILNQCNTVFAMRTFDDTGKEFLANYLGRSYADSLHNLQARHAVFFGKASSCENPVLLRLNDREDFTVGFRAQHPIPAPPAAAAVPPPPPPDEDIPY